MSFVTIEKHNVEYKEEYEEDCPCCGQSVWKERTINENVNVLKIGELTYYQWVKQKLSKAHIMEGQELEDIISTLHELSPMYNMRFWDIEEGCWMYPNDAKIAHNSVVMFPHVKKEDRGNVIQLFYTPLVRL